jgi:hypothetical protein
MELYGIGNFLKFSYTHLIWWKLEKRAKVVWTKKASLIYVLTILLMLLLAAFFFLQFSFWGLLFSLALPKSEYN